MKNKKENKKFLATYFFLAAFLFAAGFFADEVQAAASCQSGETCMDTITTSGMTFGPNGYSCTFRGACDGTKACCKANGSEGASVVEVASSSSSSSTTTQTSGSGTSFTNPLKFSTVEGFVGSVLLAIRKIIVSLALVFIVIGALLYITAGANPDNAENGKKAITAAMVGLAIGIGAPSILKELGGIIGWGSVDSSAVGGAITLSQIAINTLNFLLGILGIIALIMLVIGASMYLTSAGDEDRIDQGKRIFKYSLLGMVIAMSSMVLVRQIAAFFTVG